MHIADVSYFVKEDTALDEAASQRATSVYLVQQVSILGFVCLTKHFTFCVNCALVLFCSGGSNAASTVV